MKKGWEEGRKEEFCVFEPALFFFLFYQFWEMQLGLHSIKPITANHHWLHVSPVWDASIDKQTPVHVFHNSPSKQLLVLFSKMLYLIGPDGNLF